MTYIFITDNAIRRRLVEFFVNTVKVFLGFPWFGGTVIEIDHVVGWLVAMNVLANKTGHILMMSTTVGVGIKQVVQLLIETFSAAHNLGQLIQILHKRPLPLPSVAFSVPIAVGVVGIKVSRRIFFLTGP